MSENQPSLWDQIDEKWLPFKVAREIARSYEFEYYEEWELFIQGKLIDKSPLPANIPENPNEIYKYTGWKNWKDWLLHLDNIKDYTTFYKARAFVRCLRLKSVKKWYEYINSKNTIHEKYKIVLPKHAQYEYKSKINGWKNWDDWLGKNINYKSYGETQNFVKSLKLKTKSDWKKYCENKKSQNIYTYPEIAYKEWIDWNAWLGNDLFGNPEKKVISDIPDGAKACRCKGFDVNCIDCDGKGYFFW
ncbi:MAG: hypothetical protein K9J13_17675 [Saprospiraceae bacterium]|nr:hypothetical protein [Saprospiraceae bacterium]